MMESPSFDRAALLPRFALAMALAAIMVQMGCASAGFGRSRAASVSSGSPMPNLAAVPEWALANPGRDADSEIGIGSGSSLESATRYALQDVASRLSVTVVSQLRDVYRETSGTSVESLEQVIETHVLGTRFTGWERTRSARVDGVFWVEVRIDRRRLVRESQVELSDLAAGIDARLESARGSAIRRLLALEATKTDRVRVANLSALIDTLDPEFERSAWTERRANWQHIDESARRSLIFEVRSDPASQEIARWLESELASERLVARTGRCVSQDAICIDIRSELVEANIANRHVAKIRSFFAIVEPGGSVVRQTDLTGRGDSKSDKERARRMALDDLRNSLHSSSVLGGLITP
jgi:hypothetical protein